MSYPESYATWNLPDLKLAHYPENAPTATKVVVVILNRPKAKNAFTGAMAESLIKAFQTLSEDPRVKCVVLTGSDASNKVFCAGADLDIGFTGSKQNPSHDTYVTHRDSGGRVSLAIYRCNKPVVVALNGSGVGVGITMTLGADLRVASNKARYGFVFSRRGLTMEACSSYFLPRLLGTSAANFLTTTGAALPPDHKMLSSLFAEIVAPDQVLPTALKWASDIAVNTSVVSTRVMKDLLYQGPPGSPEEAHLLESKLIFQRFQNRDLVEGIASFKERRDPEFPGTLEEDGPIGWPWWDTDFLKRANRDLSKL